MSPTTDAGHLPDDAAHSDVAAVLAVKALGRAKSRLAAGGPLASASGTAPNHREAAHREAAHRGLVLAMLLDTIAAVRDAGVDRILVVSPDDAVLDAVARVGATGLRELRDGGVGVGGVSGVDGVDGVSGGPDAGLNHALAQGAGRATQDAPHIGRILFIQADLPAATGTALADVLATSAPHRQAFLTDHTGHGTALLVRDASIVEPTRFGLDSAAEHRRAGAVELDPDHRRWIRLRTDVDTVADLEAALRLGVGAQTAATLADTEPCSGLIARGLITDEPNAS